jgi:anti-sigma regulatory factor (Ser/Thr protein kinase)
MRHTADLDVELARGPEAPSDARAAVRELCRECDVSSSQRSDLVLLVSEIVTNAVMHSEDRRREPFRLTATLDERMIHVALADSGYGLEREAKHGAGGYGLYLLDKLARDWGVERVGDQSGVTRVWFELARAASR